MAVKKKLEQFFEDLERKRKILDTAMRIQTDQEFNQSEIKKLNEKYKVDMFNTYLGKAFPVEQKIRKFKKVLFSENKR